MSDVQPAKPETSAVTKDLGSPPDSVRLGLALSGGGFRASLFHLGVLTRLAELDLLRHLHAISSVSGGSVVAAHYMLLLKRALERSPRGRLEPREYIALVRLLRRELTRGVRREPRNDLLLNPFSNLSMAWLGFTSLRTSMSQRMEQRYQRYFYSAGTRRIVGTDRDRMDHGIPLSEMKVKPPGASEVGDHQLYNALPDTDCVPELVLNSATLNTATRFTFTFAEVGDEVLGYVRFDEIERIAAYRRLLEVWTPGPDPHAATDRAIAQASVEPAKAAQGVGAAPADPFERLPHLPEHLAWWHEAQLRRTARPGIPAAAPSAVSGTRADDPDHSRTSSAIRFLDESPGDGQRLLEAPFFVLRRAKVAAWYLLARSVWDPRDADRQVWPPHVEMQRGGLTRTGHRERFWGAIRDIDKALYKRIGSPLETPLAAPARETDWYEFVIELYYMRIAMNLDRKFALDIRLPRAVQASANFPPVFGALRFRGLYEHRLVRALQLSDGGLNDNNGLEALFEARCTHIIASDAGPRPEVQKAIGTSRLGMMSQIMVNQLPIVRRLLTRTLREQERVHAALDESKDAVLDAAKRPLLHALWDRYPVEAFAFFFMDSNLSDGLREDASPPPLAEHPHARDIAKLRTDLDGFNRVEQDALLYQGYQYCDRFVRQYVYDKLADRGLVPAKAPPPRPPSALPRDDENEQVRRVIRAGTWQFGRVLRLRPPLELFLWSLASALGFAALVGLAAIVALPVRAALELLQHAPWFWRGLAAIIMWIAAPFLWVWAAVNVIGAWLWIDGRLATMAARIKSNRGR